MKKESNSAHHAMHVGFEIAKIGLKIASVAAAFIIVKELQKLHEEIAEHNEHHHLLPFVKK